MLISLCMIVRDEAAFIEECLASARACVDEIIVVDTGSTDRTMEIARRFGAQVFSHPWTDDFSAPRNTALEKASGDYILALDADERLGPGAAEKLVTAAREGECSGYFLPLINWIEGEAHSECFMLRLFVNNPEVRYCYAIHEQVLPDLMLHARKTGKPIGVLKAPIDHIGYEPDVVTDRKKQERNYRLFCKQLRLYPRDVYSWYKYATFLGSADAPEETIRGAWERAFELLLALPPAEARKYPFAAEVAAFLGQAYSRTGKSPCEALQIMDEGVARFTPTPSLFFLKAGMERACGLPEAAIKSYQHCLDLAGDDFMVPVADGTTSWRAMAGIGSCLLESGHWEDARRAYQDSLCTQPDQIESYSGLAELCCKKRDYQGALTWLLRLLERRPGYSPAWKVGSGILAAMGHPRRALAWETRAREIGAAEFSPECNDDRRVSTET